MSEVKTLSGADQFPFGKYKGVPVSSVAKVNPGYLRWFSKTITAYKLADGLIPPPRTWGHNWGDDDDDSPDEWGGMDYSDFGNN